MKTRLFITGLGIILLIGLSLILSDYSREQNLTGLATKEIEPIICEDYDLEDLEDTNYERCLDFADELRTGMATQNLDAEGYDILYFITLASMESNCDDSYKGGILQADYCLSNFCPTTQDRVNKAFEVYGDSVRALKNKDLTQDEYNSLVLYGYNRGPGLAARAADQIAEGESLQEAMVDTCTAHFNTPEKLYDDEGNNKCTYYGYGAKYAEKFLDTYEKVCEAASGDGITTGFSKQKVKFQKFGIYKVKPYFTTQYPITLKPYEELKTFAEGVISECQNDPEYCLNQKITEFNDNHDDVKVRKECEEGPERVLFDYAERIYDCSKTESTDCFCPFTKYYHESVLGDDLNDEEFKFKVEYKFEEDGLYNYEISIEEPENLDYSIVVSVPFEIDFEEFEFRNDASWITDIADFFQDIIGDSDNGKFLYLSNNKFQLAEVVVTDRNKLRIIETGEEIDKDFCPGTKKTQFRMCAVIENELPRYKESQVVYEKPKVKFALTLEDNKPPKISQTTNSVVNDVSLTKRFVILEWPESQEQISQYNVYHSDADFSSASLNYAKQNTEVDELLYPYMPSSAYVEIKSYGLINCFGQCMISTSANEQPIQKGRYFKMDGNIVYVLELPDEDYYIAVTAVDAAGNENQISTDNYITIPAS